MLSHLRYIWYAKICNGKLNTDMLDAKIRITGAYNYDIGSPITFDKISDNGYFGLVLPAYHTINTFSFNVSYIHVAPGADHFSILSLFKNDGTQIASGKVDVLIILFPV